MKRITIVLMGLLTACVANADEERAGWQIGFAGATSQFERDDKVVDDSGVGLKLFTQYRMNAWFGLEGAYFVSGDFSSSQSTGLSSTVDFSYRGPIIQGVGYIPLSMEEVDIYVKAGLFDFRLDLDVDGAPSGSGSDTGAVLGIGTAVTITDRFRVRGEFDWYDVEAADLWTISLGLQYHF